MVYSGRSHCRIRSSARSYLVSCILVYAEHKLCREETSWFDNNSNKWRWQMIERCKAGIVAGNVTRREAHSTFSWDLLNNNVLRHLSLTFEGYSKFYQGVVFGTNTLPNGGRAGWECYTFLHYCIVVRARFFMPMFYVQSPLDTKLILMHHH